MRRVVLLPGLGGTGALFAEVVRAAGRDARLEPVALPPGPLGYVALAERLGPALALTYDTILVAKSYSGPLAAHLAAAHLVAAPVAQRRRRELRRVWGRARRLKQSAGAPTTRGTPALGLCCGKE